MVVYQTTLRIQLLHYCSPCINCSTALLSIRCVDIQGTTASHGEFQVFFSTDLQRSLFGKMMVGSLVSWWSKRN